jgi:SRSO17 transposase
VEFQPKWKIALAQIDRALAAGVRKHVGLADSAYGDVGEFREGLTERGLPYVVGVKGEPIVWPPESRPAVPPRPPRHHGKWTTRYRDEEHPPVPIAELALHLKYRRVSWREGSRGWQSSRFAAARVRTAHRHYFGHPPGHEQWLLCEWPEGEKAPTKHWLSTLPATRSLRSLVRLAKLRWRIERDYQEMKQELGLDHFEGRTWRGLHHHATLCAVAHGFLALRRALFPPEADALDAPDGEAVPSTGAASTSRVLPTVPPTYRWPTACARRVPNVIE